MIGKNLAHYRIIEKLGAGGMGEVYVAEDTKIGRQVALKVLPPEMATGERLMRFEREAKAVATLDHPNIVTIHSVEEAEGIHFYTMQLVKGKTLTELLPKKGLPLSKLLEIAIPLADAVSVAHEQGITHRDIKPDNLMLGGAGRLKILDFGLAKLKQEYADEVPGSELPTEHRTEEGRILGTVAYMSPEQAEGKTVDHRSDIFSIGILLYEMATGERPFQGDTKASIMSSILKDTPQSVTQVNPNLPRDLGRIIQPKLAS
jgi:serine/threonine protein kinase